MKPAITEFTFPYYGLRTSKVSSYVTICSLVREQLLSTIKRELQIVWLINSVEHNIHLHLYEYGE